MNSLTGNGKGLLDKSNKKTNGHNPPTGSGDENVIRFGAPQSVHREPAFNIPPVTGFLILANLGIHFLRAFFFGPQKFFTSLYAFGFVADRYTGSEPLAWEAVVSPFSYMFVHGSWLHVFINIAMLAAFGAGVEKQIGGKKMLGFYILTGFFSAWFHMIFYWHSQGVLIGASGAISGLFGGVLMILFKKGHMGPGVKSLLPAVVVWIGMAVLFGFVGTPGGEGSIIAWTAHIGGFFAGLLLYGFFDPQLRQKTRF